jgi:guanylate kinase
MTPRPVGAPLMWVEGWGDLPGRLVVVSGPSGCGKSTIIRGALEQAPGGLDLQLSVSATTRSRRPGEEHGVDYYFMDVDQFESIRGRREFLEWAEYNNQYYGTPAIPVYNALKAGKTVLLEIEVQGALQVRSHAPSSLFVFIRTPTFRDLERRLRGRGTESNEAILRRLRKAREELAEAHWYDVQLTNDDFDRCLAEFVQVLNDNGWGG